MSKGFNAWFIGPKGENAKIVEELLMEAFRDHLYWRKNFHPEDSQDIQEIDKVSEYYHASVADLRKYLFEVLARIKQSVPFYSPRYIGHMTSDSLIPAIVGYVATMFYNANNISPLGSPVTTPYEIEVGRDFARLMGYEIDQSWGHITSGGTVANLEAMWVARNLKYFSLVIKRVVKELNYDDFTIKGKLIQNFTPWELLSLSSTEALSLRESLVRHMLKKCGETQYEIEKKVDKKISSFAPSKIGWTSFFREFGQELSESKINEGVVLVPKTKHYSWTKAMDIFGLGSENLVSVAIDEHYRIDIESLKKNLRELEAEKKPIIMIVGVLGSTEEGNIDPLKDIADCCPNYYKHVDAAYGGYFTTLLYKFRGSAPKKNDIDLGNLESLDLPDFIKSYQELGINHPDTLTYLHQTLTSLKRFDSVTIDPHKLGYVPIPAGGIVFKDKKVRELISFTAPYAFSKGEEDTFIGQYILEGSKPGASAVACYLAHKVVPPTVEGYGYILGRTIKAAKGLWERINNIAIDKIRIIPIAEPDTNVLCFVVNFTDNKSLSVLNKLNKEIYKQLSVDDKKKPIPAYNYLISKTEFKYEEYKSVATDNLLDKLGIPVKNYVYSPDRKEEADEIVVLRMCAMNPWSCEKKYLDGFMEELKRVLEKFVHKILIVEDEENVRKRLQDVLEVSAGHLYRFDWREAETFEKGIAFVAKEKFDVIILDLMLKDENGNDADGCVILKALRDTNFRKTPVVVYTQMDIDDPALNKELKGAGFIEDTDRCIYKKDDKSEVRVFSEIFQRLLQ